jgi:hypothetical protein
MRKPTGFDSLLLDHHETWHALPTRVRKQNPLAGQWWVLNQEHGFLSYLSDISEIYGICRLADGQGG